MPLPADVYFLDYVPFAGAPGGPRAWSRSSRLATGPRAASCRRARRPRLAPGEAMPPVAMSVGVDSLAVWPEPLEDLHRAEVRAGHGLRASTFEPGGAGGGRSGPRGRASRRCCTCSAGSTGRTPARVEVVGQALDDAVAGASAGAVPQPARSASCSSSTSCCRTSPPRRTSRCPARIAGVAAARGRWSGARALLARGRSGRPARPLPEPALGRRAAARRARRALALEPPLLLADEPTGNLDPAAASRCSSCSASSSAERGTTTILVTHNPELAKRCDRLF